jgi:hypothetical protein
MAHRDNSRRSINSLAIRAKRTYDRGAFRLACSSRAEWLAWAQIEGVRNAPFSDVKYVYDPEALKTMGAAFDTVCRAFPPDLKHHESGEEETGVTHPSTHGSGRASCSAP